MRHMKEFNIWKKLSSKPSSAQCLRILYQVRITLLQNIFQGLLLQMFYTQV